MSTGYLQIDREILNSTVWVGTDSDTKAFWFFLLLTADIKTGIVSHTIPAIVRDTGISRDKIDELLTKFSSPDPDSRSKEHEGRRIEYIDSANQNGGIRVLNYGKYREKHLTQSAERMRKKRERDKKCDGDVTHCDACYVTVTKEKEKENKLKKEIKKKEETTSVVLSESEDIRHVFNFWVSVFGSKKGQMPKLDKKRKGKITARLKEGFTVDQLCKAVSGASRSDFHITNGYTKLETILRDAGTVENHIARVMQDENKTDENELIAKMNERAKQRDAGL